VSKVQVLFLYFVNLLFVVAVINKLTFDNISRHNNKSNYIVWDAHNTVFSSRRSCAECTCWHSNRKWSI